MRSIIKMKQVLMFVIASLIFLNAGAKDKPNIVFILADDMGYECVGSYGSLSYKTPQIDNLASNGIQFENCVANPLCSPTRLKLMTGLRNFRNYEHFAYIDNNHDTFGNIMRRAGYATCISGKWQLNGLENKDIIKDWDDKDKPNKLGFDEFCLWQFTLNRQAGERYANPKIDKNGTLLDLPEDAYGPDIFNDFVLDFIERKKDEPFFIYYPMVLVHDPFVPTPDSKDWIHPDMRYKNDTAYFKDMVAYADKMVGKVVEKLKELELFDNTIVIFTGDNGTLSSISTKTNHGIVVGGKGTTTDAGTHVPLIISWSEEIEEASHHEGLIEFCDFFPTIADVGSEKTEFNDGISFLSLLKGEKYSDRETAVVHYNPMWAPNVQKNANQFARTLDYKLYQDGKFYNLKEDILEKHPIALNTLTAEQKEAYSKLKAEIDKLPKWDPSIPTKEYFKIPAMYRQNRDNDKK